MGTAFAIVVTAIIVRLLWMMLEGNRDRRVTRFEVIDHRFSENQMRDVAAGKRGRVLSLHGVTIALSYQDDGQTLKVFVGDHHA